MSERDASSVHAAHAHGVATVGLRAAALISLFALAAQAQRAVPQDLAETVESAEREVDALAARLAFVAKEYVGKEDVGEAARLKKRFQDAEIQFLLEDFQRAAFLLYDVAENETFKADPAYPTALYYLGESLFQQKNYLAARPFLRQALSLGVKQQQECLLRLVQISDALGDPGDIEEYMEKILASGAKVRPEIQYVYAKWQHHRTDLPDTQRIPRAREAFYAIPPDSAYHPQALYFLGTLAVEGNDLAMAEKFFSALAQREDTSPTRQKIRELANLALGRIAYEQGRFADAIDRYQEIPRQSPYYGEALYEISWCYLKKGEPAKALLAVELLLLATRDVQLEPQARLLQGDLLTRLGRYQEAVAVYNGLVEAYEPAKQALTELLVRHEDAVRFFDTLAKKSDGELEMRQLLPPAAVTWARAQKEISDSVRILGDLSAGQKGVEEALDLADRLEKAVAEKQVEIFPTLQEGIGRAVEVENSLIRLRHTLVQVEEKLYAGGELPAALAAEIAERRKERKELEAAYKALPHSPEELAARRTRTSQEFNEVSRKANRLTYEAQALMAILNAMQKYLDDTRGERTTSPSFDPKEERELAARLVREKEMVQALLDERRELVQSIETWAARVAVGEGLTTRAEQQLRARYGDAVEKERAALEKARPLLSPQAYGLAAQVDKLHGKVATLEANVASLRDQLREAAARRAEDFRRRVAAEKAALQAYQSLVSRAERDTSTLVGEVTFDSFQKVKGQIHKLVLQADVGLVDVAWARKREKSEAISKLARDRDEDLRLLEEQFKEVLKEAD